MGSIRALGLAILALLAGSAFMNREVSAEAPSLEVQISQQVRGALATQAMTRERLRVFGGGARCSDAKLVSYRRSDREREIADQWYVASQLWADAVLLSAVRDGLPIRDTGWNEREARCHLDKGFAFLELLWDDGEGGFYPRSNLMATRVSRATQYADDNAVAGLALLAAADAFPDAFSREFYLYAATLEAEYLEESGLWDDTFGGGFWWNTGRGDTDEGKPAQSNALAALFFARLHAVTGLERYGQWSLAVLRWMDSALLDESRSLYRWSVRYQNTSTRAGAPVFSNRYFNYDQGIAIEAQLAAAKLDGDAGRIERARAIGQTLHAAFWNRDRGGYNLEAGVEQVYASYAAWASLGHLALFDHDADRRWLDMALANAGSLTATLREADGGYAYRHFHCGDSRAPGCSGGARWAVDRTRDTAAQAWMQHLQTSLARTLASSARPPRS